MGAKIRERDDRASKPFRDVLGHLRRSGLFVRREAVEVDRVPSGIAGVDWVLGGGWPRGRILEVFGMEGSGKTTLLAETAKAFQESGHLVVYLDYEHSADLSWFKKIGVQMENDGLWLFDQPFSLESGADAALDLVATGKVGLLVVDTVAAMTPQGELDGSMDESSIGLQARGMGKFLRKLAGSLSKTDTCAVFLNQVRDRIGWDAKFNPFVTPAGKALKFWAKIRLEMKRTSKRKDDPAYVEGVTHHEVRLRKNHLGPVQSAVTTFAVGSTGVDRVMHLGRCLLDVGLVERRGEKFHAAIGGEPSIGEDAYHAWVAENQTGLTASYVEKMRSAG